MPFMIVSGDHASNDMAGLGQDSWKNNFINEGFEVECIMKGLGGIFGNSKYFCRTCKVGGIVYKKYLRNLFLRYLLIRNL